MTHKTLSNNNSSQDPSNKSINAFLAKYEDQQPKPTQNQSKNLAKLKLDRINKDIDKQIIREQNKYSKFQTPQPQNKLNNSVVNYAYIMHNFNDNNNRNLMKDDFDWQNQTNTTFQLLDSSKSSSLDIDELLDTQNEFNMFEGKGKKRKSKERDKYKQDDHDVKIDNKNEVSFNLKPTVYESDLMKTMRINSLRKGTSGQFTNLINLNNQEKTQNKFKNQTNNNKNINIKRKKQKTKSLHKFDLKLIKIKQNQLKAKMISKKEQMDNLRKNNDVFKKVDKINKKNLNEGLKNIQNSQVRRKSTVFVEKFEMNKRDQLLNIKKAIGIAGKKTTKTAAQLELEMKEMKKKEIQAKVEESKKISKREYMENLKLNINSDLKNNSNRKNDLNDSKNINEIQLNAKNKLNIENTNLRKIATMRKATIKNLEKIGDVDLLDEEPSNQPESPIINKEYQSKLRQDLSVIFGDEYNQQTMDLSSDNPNQKSEFKTKIKQDLSVIFGDEYPNQSENKSQQNSNQGKDYNEKNIIKNKKGKNSNKSSNHNKNNVKQENFDNDLKMSKEQNLNINESDSIYKQKINDFNDNFSDLERKIQSQQNDSNLKQNKNIKQMDNVKLPEIKKKQNNNLKEELNKSQNYKEFSKKKMVSISKIFEVIEPKAVK